MDVPLRDICPARLCVVAVFFVWCDPFAFAESIELFVVIRVVVKYWAGVIADDVLDDADAFLVGEVDEITVVLKATFSSLGVGCAVEFCG